MKEIILSRTVPALLLALAFALSTLPALAGDSEARDKDVRVKVIQCEGGDCTDMSEKLVDAEDVKVVVAGGEGKKILIRKVHCDGDDCEEHENTHNMVFVGDNGEVEVMAGGGGHAWVGRHGLLGGGYLGVSLTELTPELREHFGVSPDAGVMVSKVMADSPASKAGLEPGDIIERVDGEAVANGSALARAIRARKAGETVLLDVWRDGSPTAISAAVETRDLLGDLGTHLGDLGKKMRKIMVECDSDDVECESNLEFAGLDEFDCGGSDDCEVEVECKEGDCLCSINGEDADCAGIPGVPGQ